MSQALELLRRATAPGVLLRGAEAGLVALIAVQAAALVWIVATPRGSFGAEAAPAPSTGAASADLTVLSRFDPFLTGEPGPSGGAARSGEAGGFVLYGTRTDVSGRGGSAILGAPGGVQGSFAVGDEVAPGVRLAAVAVDHVVLDERGSRRRLGFPAAAFLDAAATAPTPVPAVAQTAGAAVDPQVLVRQLGLRPNRVDGRARGYVVTPREGGGALAAAGLRSGDVILTVNGADLTPEHLEEHQAVLASGGSAVLGVERDGRPMTITLRAGRP